MEKRYRNIILFVSSILLVNNMNAVDLDGNSFQIKSLYSGNCIEVENNSTEDGVKLIQYTCKDDDSQKFTFSKNSDNSYSISTSNGKNLFVASNSSSNGVNIVQSSSNKSNFIVEDNSLGQKIKIQESKKYISMEDTSNDIVQFYGNNSDKQQWLIENFNSEPIPYYESNYTITEYNQNTANNGNLTSALSQIKETWLNKYYMMHGVRTGVLPYAILDAGKGKKFIIGNLRTLGVETVVDPGFTNSFKVSISNDGVTYTKLYESLDNNAQLDTEHVMSGEARYIKFEATATGYLNYARIIFDTNFPFWDLSIVSN